MDSPGGPRLGVRPGPGLWRPPHRATGRPGQEVSADPLGWASWPPTCASRARAPTRRRCRGRPLTSTPRAELPARGPWAACLSGPCPPLRRQVPCLVLRVCVSALPREWSLGRGPSPRVWLGRGPQILCPPPWEFQGLPRCLWHFLVTVWQLAAPGDFVTAMSVTVPTACRQGGPGEGLSWSEREHALICDESEGRSGSRHTGPGGSVLLVFLRPRPQEAHGLVVEASSASTAGEERQKATRAALRRKLCGRGRRQAPSLDPSVPATPLPVRPAPEPFLPLV